MADLVGDQATADREPGGRRGDRIRAHRREHGAAATPVRRPSSISPSVRRGWSSPGPIAGAAAKSLPVTCELGTLAAGETATVRVGIVSPSPGLLLNRAVAGTDSNDQGVAAAEAESPARVRPSRPTEPPVPGPRLRPFAEHRRVGAFSTSGPARAGNGAAPTERPEHGSVRHPRPRWRTVAAARRTGHRRLRAGARAGARHLRAHLADRQQRLGRGADHGRDRRHLDRRADQLLLGAALRPHRDLPERGSACCCRSSPRSPARTSGSTSARSSRSACWRRRWSRC